MGLTPLGVSGSSGGASTGGVYPTATILPGQVYYLSRWVGHSLRKVIVAGVGDDFMGRLQVTDRLPSSLDPELAFPDAKIDIPLRLNYYSPVNTFDFPPGLVTVNPGETLYVVVYDWRSNVVNAKLTWAFNMLWEPWKEAK